MDLSKEQDTIRWMPNRSSPSSIEVMHGTASGRMIIDRNRPGQSCGPVDALPASRGDGRGVRIVADVSYV